MGTLSREKMFILNMSDEEIKLLLRYVKNLPPLVNRKGRPQSSAMNELNNLIGLTDVKDTIRKMVAENRMRAIAASRGKPVKKASNHMCFIGNPGTYKTTIANLCTQLFYEEGLICKNKIIVADRSDLVGVHCGETAVKTKALIGRSKGGVLFIDEAYSLLEDREGGFGDEAVNTLIIELENNRSDVIVILAGYPDKMKRFLGSNPGLKSRIPNTVYFPDYSPEELYWIAERIANENGYRLSANAHDQLVEIFEKASKLESFGNGRFARNIVEKAQSNRAMQVDFTKADYMSDEDLFLLTAHDFVSTRTAEDYCRKKRIGFSGRPCSEERT